MSLAVWLPLNGDLHNQGLDNNINNIIDNNTVVNNNGKIGKCYSFNGTNSYIRGNSFSSINNDIIEFSFSCWVKFNSVSINHCLFSCRTGTNSKGFNIFYMSNGTFYFDTGSRWTFTPEDPISVDKWYHICFTWKKNGDNQEKKYYCNGNLKNESITTFVLPTAASSYFGIGGSQSSSTNINANWFNGYINDVRIYDHCLSPKEVEEISKGLVLHYKLDNNGMGGDNLALNTRKLDIASSETNLYMYRRGTPTIQLRNDGFSELKCTTSWQGLSFWANQLNLSPGTKVTYSFYIYGNGSSRNLGFYPMMYNSAGTRDQSTGLPISIDGGAYTTANSKIIANIRTATSPEYHYVTFEWNQAVANIITNGGSIELSIQVFGTWNSGDWACIFAPKLEIGDKPTTWSPAKSELGDMATTIYDCSGYSNNGTIIGNLGTVTSSPRYNCCIEHLDSCADYIYREYLSFLGDSGFTFSCWINPSSYSRTTNTTTAVGNQFILSQGRDTITSGTNNTYGASLIINNGKPNFLCGNGNLYSNTIIPIGEWAHVVGVWTGTQKKIYVNGILKNSANNNKIDWSEAQNSLVIGKMAFGKSSSTAYHPFVGKISDVRIYATALTDSQIKELYNTSMQIDSSGNVFARELVEL